MPDLTRASIAVTAVMLSLGLAGVATSTPSEASTHQPTVVAASAAAALATAPYQAPFNDVPPVTHASPAAPVSVSTQAAPSEPVAGVTVAEAPQATAKPTATKAKTTTTTAPKPAATTSVPVAPKTAAPAAPKPATVAMTINVPLAGGQAAIDSCQGAVLYAGFIIAQHNYCGGSRFFSLKTGSLVTLTGKVTGTFRVEGVVDNRVGSSSYPRGSSGYLLQTSLGGGNVRLWLLANA